MSVLAAVLAHLLMAMLAPALVRRLGGEAFRVAALVPAATTVWAIAASGPVIAGTPLTEAVPWVPGYDLALAFRLDTLALLMVVVVAGVGALVLFYCRDYFPPGQPGTPGLAGLLVAFAGAMLGLVLADDLILLYIFWELTTVFSYLLIGFKIEDRDSRRAAMTAIMVTTFGGLAMLVGLIMLGLAAGTFRLSQVLAQPPSGAAVSVALALILVGALSKSALIPFHFWLPAAMAAPTPVSAYLHAAAMVKAGVYLVARFAPAFAGVPPWRITVMAVGTATMLLGAWRALRQVDLKLLLAFGTVSQLGFLVVLLGTGSRAAALAGVVMLLAHAAFKAALFMVVGIVDHATGTRDLRRLSGLGGAMPAVFATAALASASMAGLPPFLGYVGKEAAFTALAGDPWVLAGVFLGSVLTFAYSARFLWGAFARKPEAERTEARRTAPAFAAPAAILALAGPVLGLAVSWLNPVVAEYAGLYPPGPHAEPLALWHGPTPALAMSALVVAGGTALFAARATVSRVQTFLHTGLDAERAYRLLMRGVDLAAGQATRFTQRGSLPAYLRVVLTVLLLVPGGALVAGARPAGTAQLWDIPGEIGVVALICMAAMAVALIPGRLSAAVCAGVTGTGTAVLFVLYGAPDLGLTQLLVETVTLVAFALTLRRLSPRFGARQLIVTRAANAVIAIAVGVVAASMVYAAVNARTAPPASRLYPEATREAGGTNIVNTALVDLRAWDTLGESTVLVVAAIGMVGLIFGSRRPERPRLEEATGGVWSTSRARAVEAEEEVQQAPTWLRGSETLAPERRSVVFEVVARAVFHPMVLLSFYLLFSGHGSPGGGFAAGIVAGLALALRYLAGGRYELGEALPVGPGVCQGIGLTIVSGTALAGLAFTGTVLTETELTWHLPVLGEVHFLTSTIFDVGVYLVVVGVVLDILRSLGGEIDRRAEEKSEDVVTA